MNPTDPNKSLEVTLEWDKNERQRARNRINQRNYRRRKSEQQKEREKEKERTKSASRSPRPPSTTDDAPTFASNLPEVPSIIDEVAVKAADYSQASSPWNYPSISYQTTLPSMAGPSRHTGAEAALGGVWSATHSSSMNSPNQTPEYQGEVGDWQAGHTFQDQLTTSNMSAQMQNAAWAGSPGLYARSPSSDTSTAVSSRGKTTLHLAAENGHNQCLQVLLFHGADPNVRDADGRTALHVAAEHGHKDIVAILLAGGCDPNALTPSGRTALHLAAENNQFEVVDHLIRVGCDPNFQITEL